MIELFYKPMGEIYNKILKNEGNVYIITSLDNSLEDLEHVLAKLKKFPSEPQYYRDAINRIAVLSISIEQFCYAACELLGHDEVNKRYAERLNSGLSKLHEKWEEPTTCSCGFCHVVHRGGSRWVCAIENHVMVVAEHTRENEKSGYCPHCGDKLTFRDGIPTVIPMDIKP